MFDGFSHFLAYGSTDQQTLTDLAPSYDGIVVPGTVAAFQAEGTQGFVLTLSASQKKPYLIDPRFPLFQNDLRQPKKSHLSLARVFGLEDVVEEYGAAPLEIIQERIDQVCARWFEFNTAFRDVTPKAFNKYARRLKRSLPIADAQGPTWIVPPYLIADESPVAASISKTAWLRTLAIARNAGHGDRVRPVVAVGNPENLLDASNNLGADEVLVWVSNLDETKSSLHELAAYAKNIRSMTLAGVRPFALYGGYFATMLRSVGLRGVSHGVGFSEHRNHIELKSSGGAPARYYVRRIHRYLPVDLASELWRRDRTLVEDLATPFGQADPAELDYHSLMKHSVWARRAEIDAAESLTIHDHVRDLKVSRIDFLAGLEDIRLTAGLKRRSSALVNHLTLWEGALTEAAIGP